MDTQATESGHVDGFIVPLDGPLERNKYPPVLGLLFGLIVAFIASQIITGIAMAVLILLAAPAGEMTDALTSLAAYPDEVFIANSIGQVFGLALMALFFARLHSHQPLKYVRLRGISPIALILVVVGWAALFPFVNWLAVVNEALPVPQPEWLQEMEQSTLELIENFLRGRGGMVLPLLMLAVTPAVCEELLFRGYLQRQLERMGGVAAGILASGIIFGLFHLRLTQALPLCVLGIYLAYITWRTKSLWPAILVHFSHNAFAIMYTRFAPEAAVQAESHAVEIPFYIVAIGLVVFAGTMYLLHNGMKGRNEHLRKWVPITPETTFHQPEHLQ